MERRRTRRPPQHPGVLVVDGHADTRDLYAETLRSFGFETDTVDEVGDACEILLSTDTGRQFIQDHKRDARTRDIPVVVVTSQGQGCVRARAEQEGCAAFLVKPCLPDDLAIALREVLYEPLSPFGDGADPVAG